jgi:hypothetical protein
MKSEHLARFVGTVRPVLWEGAGDPQPDGTLSWSGYTDNYLRVHTRVAAGIDLDNQITPSLLSARDGEALRGESPAPPGRPL